MRNNNVKRERTLTYRTARAYKRGALSVTRSGRAK